MNENVTCSIKKSGKEDSRNCAKGLLTKVMKRNGKLGDSQIIESGYTVDEIEKVIYDNFSSRDEYLEKIAKVALHLSLFTKTGRSSYTFQSAIFNRQGSPKTEDISDDDYLTWLVTRATNEEIFPELYLSGRYIEESDRKTFQTHMRIEFDAIYAGLQQIVRQCCDSKICTVEDIEIAYDSELFKTGTPFEMSARSICSTRHINHWIPPSDELFIPDSTPVQDQTIEIYSDEEDTGDYQLNLERQASVYQSAKSGADINRNFDLSGQITCFNIDNLIHNLAILQEGKRLELPWNGELLDRGVQEQLFEKFRVEIGMRKYYLQQLKQ